MTSDPSWPANCLTHRKIEVTLLLSFFPLSSSTLLYVHRALVSHAPHTQNHAPLFFACMHALLLLVCVVILYSLVLTMTALCHRIMIEISFHCPLLHSANRFKADYIEAFIQHHGSCLTQEQATHVDLYDLSSLSILLDTVACIVELSERGTELVEVVTQYVRE